MVDGRRGVPDRIEDSRERSRREVEGEGVIPSRIGVTAVLVDVRMVVMRGRGGEVSAKAEGTSGTGVADAPDTSSGVTSRAVHVVSVQERRDAEGAVWSAVSWDGPSVFSGGARRRSGEVRSDVVAVISRREDDTDEEDTDARGDADDDADGGGGGGGDGRRRRPSVGSGEGEAGVSTWSAPSFSVCDIFSSGAMYGAEDGGSDTVTPSRGLSQEGGRTGGSLRHTAVVEHAWEETSFGSAAGSSSLCRREVGSAMVVAGVVWVSVDEEAERRRGEGGFFRFRRVRLELPSAVDGTIPEEAVVDGPVCVA